jgi:two-component system, LytTR family, sensor kinase
MKKILFPVFFNMVFTPIFGQIDTSQMAFGQINLHNYSTSFSGDMAQKTPLLIVATPNNGIYTAGNMLKDAYPQFRNKAFEEQKDLHIYDTSDSSEMHFFVANIYRSNAHNYEFRVSENLEKDLIPWQMMRVYAADSIKINNFGKGMAYLGGYKTTWNKYLFIEIRDKKSLKIIEKVAVYWQQIKPEILNIYTANDLNLFLKRLKMSSSWRLTEEEIYRWINQTPSQIEWKSSIIPKNINTDTFLPKKLLLESKEDNLIFYLKESVFKKNALEYKVVKNGDVYADWQSNDFDNNFIWLKNLGHGSYTLLYRLAMQRHNVSEYSFTIKPEWYQTKKMQFVFGLLAGILLLLMNYGLKQRSKFIKTKKEKQRIDNELRSIRSQLNPHFVFNALNSIQGLVNANKLTSANYYLTAFSTLLRESLLSNDKEFVPLSTELKTLETYIKLENLRFPFQFSIDIDEKLDTNALEIPYLLLQPLVENAIKHGVSNLYEKGVLKLRFFTEHKNLCVDITDNGKGFNPQNTSQGYGLKLTKERIRLLNQSNPDQAVTLSIKSNETNGTRAHIIFENWL